MSPNFASRWFEIDPAYQVMRVFAWLGIIDFGPRPQTTKATSASTRAAKLAAAPRAPSEARSSSAVRPR